MKLRISLLFLAAMAGTPALAQAKFDAAAATAEAARECNIPPTYVLAQQGPDGVVRVQVSPSVDPNLAECAVNVIKGFGVPVRR